MNTPADLSPLSIAELKQLQKNIAYAITLRQQQDVGQARHQIAEIAKSVGVPLKVLIAGMGKANAKPVPIKYRDPSDASRVWTGRGRSPGWVKELEQAGKLDSARV